MKRKPLSAAHKAKISKALTKNRTKKQKKEEGGIGGFFNTIGKIRSENAQLREKQNDWESHTRGVNSDEFVKIANEYEAKHGIGTAFDQKSIKYYNKPDNLARLYNYKSGKDFLKGRRENNKAKNKLDSRPFIQRFL